MIGIDVKKSKSNQEKIFSLVAKIPRGRVTTYGAIAQVLGIGSPRVVGNILHLNNDPENIPCHRVVNSQGRIAQNYAFGGGAIQRAKLEEEGIEFINNGIDLNKYLWQFTDEN